MLKLLNSMTHTKEVFRPRQEGRVKIFTCGPSIYRRPHIGNYRSFLYEDILVRYLEYKGHEVDRVINFTDIEDKSITEADSLGRDVLELTEEVSRYFFEETKMLRIKLPRVVPRSSTTVDEAAAIIKRLLAKGVAYRHDGSVYFDPLKFEGFGKLYGLDMSRWPKKRIRFSKDTYNGRRWNLGDFILWHGNKQREEPSWDTEIGSGRPSWNIQDPAIIIKHLGEQIDINCGGIDNIYRHHDYNIAVMESYSGKEFARCYLHGEHLVVDGKSMSKSRGNILYPEDVLEKGYTPLHLRFFLIYTYYRKKLNFTWDRFKTSAERLDAVHRKLGELLAARGSETEPGAVAAIEGLAARFEREMDDDLRVDHAFDAVEETLKGLSAAAISREGARRLKDALAPIDGVLQVILS